MAQKTYIQAINKVMRILREDQISDLSADYSLVIGEFVNMAKDWVEDSWQWHALRSTISWSSVADQRTYDLTADTSSGGDADVGSDTWEVGETLPLRDPGGRLWAWDVTSVTDRFQLIELPRWRGESLLNTVDTGTYKGQRPHTVFLRAGSVVFPQAPDNANRSYEIHVYTPQDELSSTGTVITVPWRPIVSMAAYLALEERGEELGIQGQQLLAKAQDDLAKAIAIDASQDPSELVMVPV